MPCLLITNVLYRVGLEPTTRVAESSELPTTDLTINASQIRIDFNKIRQFKMKPST